MICRYHLAIILHNLEGGGMQRVIINLIREFHRQQPGLRIDLVVAVAQGEYLRMLPAEINLVDLGMKDFNFRSRFIAKIIPGIRSYLEKYRPEVVLSCLPSLNFLTIIAGFGMGSSIRFFLAEHTLSFDRLLAKEKADTQKLVGLLPKIALPMMRLTYPRAQSIIAVSHGIAKELRQTLGLPHEAVKVIYNPVVNDGLRLKTQMPLLHPWFAKGQPPVFLAVGRLAKQKDYETLIRAFGRFRQNYSAKLLILGEGESRSQLENLITNLKIESEVSMPGFSDNPYIYMFKAKALILSSIWEVLPTVLIESLACGCPIISTDCDYGPREILEYGKYGILVPVGDVNALTEALELTFEKEFIDRAHLTTKGQEFNMQKAATHYLEALNASL
jgi:glycosyltransferase involved in cell wall biosynthesis